MQESNVDPNSNEYLLANIGVDTAENEPLGSLGENSIHFSVSLHVPFLNILFEQIANSNDSEYLLAKIGVDTAENEPLEGWGENSIQHSIASLVRSAVGAHIGKECR